MLNSYKYLFLICMFFLISFESEAMQKKTAKKKATSTISNTKKKNSSKKKAKKSKSKSAKTKKNKTISLSKVVVPAQDLVKQVPLVVPVLRDTSPSKEVTIISDFKPQLKNLVKINFTNAAPLVDSQSVVYNYQVPSQNLSFSYRPIALKPLALYIDTVSSLKGNTTVKVGFGNYLYQYVGVKFISVSDKSIHQLNLMTSSFEGFHHLQKGRDVQFNYQGNHKIDSNYTFLTNVFVSQIQRFRYGLVIDSLALPKENYEVKFAELGFTMALLKNIQSPYAINFKPVLEFQHLADKVSTSNNFFSLSSPLSYSLSSGMIFNFDVDFSLNQYKGVAVTTNTLLRLDPSLGFEKWKLKLLIGLSPMAKTDGFKLFPNIQLQQKLTDTNWTIQAGWTSYAHHQKYGTLLNQNPWIDPPALLKISTQEKQYVRFLVNQSKNLQYGFGISLNQYINIPFFDRSPLAIPMVAGPNAIFYSNRMTNGLKYLVLNESKATTVELNAHLNFQFSDQISVQNKINYTQFNYLKDNIKSWGYVPLDINSTFYYKPNPKFLVEGSFNLLSGIISSKEGTAYLSKTLSTAVILNAGLSYQISSPWKIWADAKNLLNQTYERWGDYPSLGVQINAGVVYSLRK